MKIRADDITAFSAVDDTLVLASVSSPAEEGLLADWLRHQRQQHPDSKIEVLKLPADDDPPPVRRLQKVDAAQKRALA